MREPVIAALVGLAALAATGLVAVWRRRQRLQAFLDSVAGILSPPQGEAIDLSRRAEATGLYRGRPTRIRLEFLGGLAKLSVAVHCRAPGTFSLTRHDEREFDARSPFTPSPRALMERHRAVSVSLEALQTGRSPDRQRYRLEIVLDIAKRPDLDPERIRAVVRAASALARVYETGPAWLTQP